MAVLAFDRFDFAAFSLLAILWVPCLLLGATVIRRIVRRVNRHDDPRHAKRPPDVL